MVDLNLPTCMDVGEHDYNPSQANIFDLRAPRYFEEHSSCFLPGLLCGIMCATLGLVFLIWLLSLRCRRHVWVHAEQSLLIQPVNRRRRRKSLMRITLVLLVAAIVAASMWGLRQSSHSTDGLVTSFWGIVDGLQQKVQVILGSAGTLFDELDALQSGLIIVNATLAGLNSTANNTEVPMIASIRPALTDSISSLPTVTLTGREDVNAVTSKVLQALQNLQHTYKHTSMEVQDIWRWVCLVSLFGSLVVIAVAAGVLTAVGSIPRTAAAFTLLLWSYAALFMLLGTGGFRIAEKVSKDSCLYMEAYAYKLAQEQYTHPQRVIRAMEYYFGALQVNDTEVAQILYGINTTDISAKLKSTQVQGLLSLVTSSTGSELIDKAKFNTTEQRQVTAMPGLVASIEGSITALQQQVDRQKFVGLYNDAKSLICCRFTDALHEMFVAWTLVGAACGVLCLLASVRVMSLVILIGPRERVELAM